MTFCALALILLVDVSGSISATNLQLQQQGLANAFRDPQMQQLIVSQPGGIAIKLVEWATWPNPRINWVHLRSSADSERLARAIEALPPQNGGNTAIGMALEHAIHSFENVPCEPERRIIDVSGDGSSNSGPDPEESKARAEQEGIVINGLPIVTLQEPEVADYYRQRVITWDGFVIEASGYEDFARAIRKKISLEIASRNQGG